MTHCSLCAHLVTRYVSGNGSRRAMLHDLSHACAPTYHISRSCSQMGGQKTKAPRTSQPGQNAKSLQHVLSSSLSLLPSCKSRRGCLIPSPYHPSVLPVSSWSLFKTLPWLAKTVLNHCMYCTQGISSARFVDEPILTTRFLSDSPVLAPQNPFSRTRLHGSEVFRSGLVSN